MIVNGPSKRIVSNSATPRCGTSSPGEITTPLPSSHSCLKVVSPSRTLNSGLGRGRVRWCGGGAGGHLDQRRCHPLARTADAAGGLVGEVLLPFQPPQLGGDDRTIDLIEGAVDTHRALESGRSVQARSRPRRLHRRLADFPVSELCPIPDRPGRLGITESGTLLDEEVLVAGENVTAVGLTGSGQHVDVIHRHPPTDQRRRRGRHALQLASPAQLDMRGGGRGGAVASQAASCTARSVAPPHPSGIPASHRTRSGAGHTMPGPLQRDHQLIELVVLKCVDLEVGDGTDRSVEPFDHLAHPRRHAPILANICSGSSL